VLRFGTDGVRGNADIDLPSDFVVALGRAIAQVLGTGQVLIGRDTRASGQRIEADLVAGLSLEGATPVLLGVLPTPAIAYHASMGAPAAIVSASHNPWTDNGVKVIGPDGRKLPDATEDAIEAALEAFAAVDRPQTPPFELRETADAADPYIAHVLGALNGRRLDGLHVVLDCANGAGYRVGPRVLNALGAQVDVVFADPDGRNINAGCGSTHPAALQAEVVSRHADLGLALDGDGDRVLAVNEVGDLVDGDEIMTMCALDLHEHGALRNNAIAVTVMTNLGLRRALRAHDIGVIETPVGDRHVVAAMRDRDLVLGGEQSGHIIFADHATTGDGLLTGVLVCDLVHRCGVPLSTLAAQMTPLPQVLVNVRVARRVDLADAPAVREAVQQIEGELGEQGRVLVRTSGTEPLVRVMVEAESQSVADDAALRLRNVVEAAFGPA
jgi:phosphoglucosamine mutase